MKEKISNIKKNKLIKNMFYILSGDGISALISVFCLSIVINSIGLEGNGKIILAQTYCYLFNDIFNFQAFNAIIKFLPYYIKSNNVIKLQENIKFSYILDIVTAIIGFIAGQSALSIISKILNWNGSVVIFARLYLFYILFNVTGTSIGLLRLYNKFKYITYTSVISNVVKLILYIVGLVLSLDTFYFLVVEFIWEILKNILLNIYTIKVLKDNNLKDWNKVKIRNNPEFLKFNFYSNLVSTMDLPIGHITSIIINQFLGVQELSIYKVFEKLGKILTKLCSAAGQALYPEISFRIAEKKYKEVKTLILKVFKVILLAGIIIIIGTLLSGEIWIEMFIPEGDKYIVILALYFMTLTITNAFMGMNHFYTAMGFIKYSLAIIPLVNIIYLMFLPYLLKNYSVLGLIIGFLLQGIMVILSKVIVIYMKFYKKQIRIT